MWYDCFLFLVMKVNYFSQFHVTKKKKKPLGNQLFSEFGRCRRTSMISKVHRAAQKSTVKDNQAASRRSFLGA